MAPRSQQKVQPIIAIPNFSSPYRHQVVGHIYLSYRALRCEDRSSQGEGCWTFDARDRKGQIEKVHRFYFNDVFNEPYVIGKAAQEMTPPILKFKFHFCEFVEIEFDPQQQGISFNRAL